MPPQVLIYTLDAFDEAKDEDSVAAAIGAQARPWIVSAVTATGGHLASEEELAACGRACVRFFRWGGLATLEIGLQREQIRNFGQHEVAAWGFAGDVAPVREALRANFALFIVLKQTRQTTGRVVLHALGRTYTYGKQIDAACVADLGDGRMTWCTSIKDDGSDIADPGQVGAVLRLMLQRLFVQPARRPSL